MRIIVLDTDTSSRIIKNNLPKSLAYQLIRSQHILTFVTRAELGRWALKRDWAARTRRTLHDWIRQRPILPGDEDVADTYANLAEDASRRGRPRPINDMWIAACCLTHGLPLATMNLKDFEDFNTYHGLQIIIP
jgi:predicted nucleic acid-binding protein